MTIKLVRYSKNGFVPQFQHKLKEKYEYILNFDLKNDIPDNIPEHSQNLLKRQMEKDKHNLNHDIEFSGVYAFVGEPNQNDYNLLLNHVKNKKELSKYVWHAPENLMVYEGNKPLTTQIKRLSDAWSNEVYIPKSSLISHLKENRNVKRHTKFNDFDLSIEIPCGSYRHGKDENNNPWQQKMMCHYGYIKLTNALDGDNLDCFVRKKPNKNCNIYVIHQLTKDGQSYDEDKVMLGFDNLQEAKRAWRSHAIKPNKMFGDISEFDQEHFKTIVHALRNSQAVVARQDVFDKLKKQGYLPKNLKSPKQILQKVKESKQIHELFDKSVNWKWKSLNENNANASFEIDKNVYNVFFVILPMENAWEVNLDMNNKDEPTGGRNEFLVLSTSIEIIKDFVKKYNPKRFMFAGDVLEFSLGRLYEKMIEKLKNEIKSQGYEFEKVDEEAGFKHFYFIRKNNQLNENHEQEWLAKLRDNRETYGEDVPLKVNKENLSKRQLLSLKKLHQEGVVSVKKQCFSKYGVPISNVEASYYGNLPIYVQYTIHFNAPSEKQPRLYD